MRVVLTSLRGCRVSPRPPDRTFSPTSSLLQPLLCSSNTPTTHHSPSWGLCARSLPAPAHNVLPQMRGRLISAHSLQVSAQMSVTEDPSPDHPRERSTPPPQSSPAPHCPLKYSAFIFVWSQIYTPWYSRARCRVMTSVPTPGARAGG